MGGSKTDRRFGSLSERRAHLTHNLVSGYDDKEGCHYQFPDRYRSQISSGDSFIYHRRGSPSHYFGAGRIEAIFPDRRTPGRWYAKLVGYRRFPHQVAFKDERGRYLERRPDIKRPPFQWAVRRIDQEVTDRILRCSGLRRRPLSEVRAEMEELRRALQALSDRVIRIEEERRVWALTTAWASGATAGSDEAMPRQRLRPRPV